MTSSMSDPNADCPFDSSTPTTLNGVFLIRILCPTGSSSGNRLSTTVFPRTATLLLARTSRSVKNSPRATSQSRISRYSGQTPLICVLQLPLPPITCPDARTMGDTAVTSVASAAIFSASSSVILLSEPAPWLTPLCQLDPGNSMIMFTPSDAIWAWTSACAPAPSPTITITAPTPMIIPSDVRRLRILFLTILFIATLRRFLNWIMRPPRSTRPRPRDRRGSACSRGRASRSACPRPGGRRRSCHRA